MGLQEGHAAYLGRFEVLAKAADLFHAETKSLLQISGLDQ
jgi:hypothetical protein